MNRRSFLKGAGLLGAGLVGSKLFPNVIGLGGTADAATKPNILFIIVDQLRTPQGAFNQALMDKAAPNLAALRTKSVSFDSHFAAATACSPSRSTMCTGLYTHQNGMFLTNAQGLAGQPSTPDLDFRFPTFGSILSSQQFGYQTYWWGKWHLSKNDQTSCDYGKYGFQGGVPCPSPNGGPAQGFHIDPETVAAFQDWLQIANRNNLAKPWINVVSLVNPHDVAWYPKYSMTQPSENNPPQIPEFHASLPSNFERWPEANFNQGKPTCQQAWVLLSDAVFGFMPTNPGEGNYPENWFQLLDLYYLVTQYVDEQIGATLKALENSPFAENTVVVFTSDHGEYGGAHGMHGKAFAVYEESIHVPLMVSDPTGGFVPKDQMGTSRSQLTSHVDLVPLLMSLASGNNAWRKQARYAHLAGRANLLAMLRNPNAKGRDYIVHSSDEDIPEEAPKVGIPYTDALITKVPLPPPLESPPPTHVIGYRTKDAKIGVYSFFEPGTVKISKEGQQSELYDYGAYGIGEVTNNAPGGSAPDPALYDQYYEALFNPSTGAIATELRRPLQAPLKKVRKQVMQRYIEYEESLT